MCDVAESTVQELLLAALASPGHKDSRARQQDLLAATRAHGVCIVDSLNALRALLRKGHVYVHAADGARDPASDPESLWTIAGSPRAAEPAGGAREESKRRVGNYVYSPADELGRGRLGIVVRGENEFLRRPVAIKFLSCDYTDDPNFRQKFERDARFLARLDHPNIVKVYDGGQDSDGTYYIAMEYIEGGTLVQLTKKMGRVSPPLVARYMYQIAQALAAAHRQGILHRDVKPDNVMMNSDGAKLTDFNLAGIDETAIQEIPSALENVASEPGSPPKLVGTLPYMAPERTNGQRGDLRSDVYSLGATGYVVAAGGLLFEGIPADNYMDWRWHHNKETPTPLTERVPGFPAALSAIVDRCLARDPDQRYQRYEDLLQDLAAVLKELPSPSGPEVLVAEPPWQTATKGRLRVPLRLLVPAVVLAGLVVFLLLNPFGGSTQPPGVPSVAKKAEADSPKPTSETNRVPVSAAPEQPQPIAAQKQPEADASPNPPPRLREKLRANPASETVQAAMLRLLDLFERHRLEFRAVSYEDAEAELQLVQAPTPGVEEEYLSLHFKAARDLLALGRGAAVSGWNEIRSAPRSIRVRLADGRALEGIVKPVSDKAFTVTDGRGQEVGVTPDTIDPRDLLREEAPAMSQLAYQILSLDSENALATVLKLEASSDGVLLWVPVAARLARLGIEDKARRSALRAKKLLADEKTSGDFIAQVPEYMDVLAAVRSMCAAEEEALSIYPYLAPEFLAARREEEALSLLLARKYSRVVTSHRGTAAFQPAAELLLNPFAKALGVAHNELFAGTGWFDWDWQLHPTEKTLEERQKYWALDGDRYPTILRDATGTRSLVMGRDHPRNPEGVAFTVQFEPDGARSEEAHWRFHLRSEKGANTYLRVDRKRVSLHRAVLAPGVGDEEISRAAIGQARGASSDQAYALFPDGESLHLFRDGEHVLSVPCADAIIPKRLAFTVVKGKLVLKRIQTRKRDNAENPK